MELIRVKSQESRIVIRKENDTTRKLVYQFCESWSENISFLKSNLKSEEILKLKLDKNTTIKLIGLISELENDNTKKKAFEILNGLINSEIEHLSYSCSYDVISSMSISNYFFILITQENQIFTPSFKLNEKERREFKNKILIAEHSN
ncbi:hypothetical protein [Gaetbulibacter jejuensis]|uniref:Uncharacterized protein n=1 Tax=Gaetbulibacter jejuensis TaxID=584607 RepID=A0ABP3UMR7_9FLAO